MQRLTGVVSLRDLIIADEDTLISSIMNDRVVSVLVSDDQEDVARMIKDYNFLAVPVVDFQQHILGIITVDDIIDVLEEEASDDYSKLAAVSNMDTFDKNSFIRGEKETSLAYYLISTWYAYGEFNRFIYRNNFKSSTSCCFYSAYCRNCR